MRVWRTSEWGLDGPSESEQQSQGGIGPLAAGQLLGVLGLVHDVLVVGLHDQRQLALLPHPQSPARGKLGHVIPRDDETSDIAS